VTSSQGIEEARHIRTASAARLLQSFNPLLESLALIDREHFIWTERRVNPRRQAAGSNRLVVRKVVGRIIRCTNDGNPEFFEDAMHREFFELFVGLRPDAWG